MSNAVNAQSKFKIQYEFKNDKRISKKKIANTIFLVELWLYNHFLTYSIGFFFFEKTAKNILERNF